MNAPTAPTALHGWRECRPRLIDYGSLSTPRQDEVSGAVAEAVAAAWDAMPDSDRQAFHHAACLDRVDEQTMPVVERLTEAARAAAVRASQNCAGHPGDEPAP